MQDKLSTHLQYFLKSNLSMSKFVNSRKFYIPFFIVAAILLYNTTVNKTSDAFKGAFFGFIVGMGTFIISKFMETQATRYNTLVYLEQELQACCIDLYTNKAQIDNILASDGLMLLFPRELRLTEEHIKQLGRLNIRNDVFSLFLAFKKYNHNIKAAIEILERNVNTFRDFDSRNVTRTVDVRSIINSFHQDFKAQLREINAFGDDVIEDIKKCLVRVRFFVKIDKTLFASNFGQVYYDIKEFEKWLIDDRQRLESEIEAKAKKNSGQLKKTNG